MAKEMESVVLKADQELESWLAELELKQDERSQLAALELQAAARAAPAAPTPTS